MNFWEKITGNDITKDLKSFEVRAKKLPDDYQVAWEKIKCEIWKYSSFSGRNLVPILEGVIELFEESAGNGQRVEMILGNDIKGFCLELTKEYGADTFRDKWRRQLNHNIAKKLGK